jgi:hypothetical protein
VTAVTAVTWVFALLLAAAGAQKLTNPAATGAALQVAKLPSDVRLVRLLGSYEIVLAGAVLLVGGTLPALLLAVTYAAFAGFAARQSRRGEGCGCFGEAEAPTTAVHVTLNVVAAVTAAAAAWSPTGALPAALGREPASLVTALVLLVTATGLLRLTLTALPELTAARALLTADSDR